MKSSLAKKLGVAVLGASSLLMTACSDSDSVQSSVLDSDYLAVIASVASDFTASEIAIAESVAPYRVLEGYAATAESDIYVATNANDFFRIGRFNIDNLTRYGFETPSLEDWQFSLKDDPADASSNAYELLFVNDQKAFLVNYGIDKIWIVNPSVDASDEDNFKLGELDISAYDSDSSPNAAAALIHDGVLYVVMQALQPDFSFGQSYLAAFNTSTNTEIDLDAGPLNGMALAVQNPQDIDVIGDNLYVTGSGALWATPNPYDGGVERISTADYSSTLLVDDNATQGENSLRIALVSATQGYIVEQEGYQNTNLYEFNPTTGALAAEPMTDFTNLDIQSLEISPEGMLWVGIGDVTSPEIRIIDPSDNTLVDTISLQMNPKGIKFTGDLSGF